MPEAITETRIVKIRESYMELPFNAPEMITFIFGRAQAEEGNMPPGSSEKELIQEAVADEIFIEGRDICLERAFRFLIFLKKKANTEYAGYLAAGIKTIRYDTKKALLHVFFSKADLRYAIEAVNEASRFTEFYMETKGDFAIEAVGIRLKPQIAKKVLYP